MSDRGALRRIGSCSVADLSTDRQPLERSNLRSTAASPVSCLSRGYGTVYEPLGREGDEVVEGVWRTRVSDRRSFRG